MIELKVTISDVKDPNKVREVVMIMLKDIIESSKQEEIKVSVNVNSNRLGYALVHIEQMAKDNGNISEDILKQFFSITTEIVKLCRKNKQTRHIQILDLPNEETKHFINNSYIDGKRDEENYKTIL